MPKWVREILSVVGPVSIFGAATYFLGFTYERARAARFGLPVSYFDRSQTDFLVIGAPYAAGAVIGLALVAGGAVLLHFLALRPVARAYPQAAAALSLAVTILCGVLMLGALSAHAEGSGSATF